MPGFIVHFNAAMTCPHALGKVIIPPGQPRVTMGPSKMAVATQPNPITVAPGCPFQVPAPPGTKPQPCVQVKWANVSARVKTNGNTTALLLQDPLTGSGNGTAQSIEQIPAGPPIVNLVQGRVRAM